MSEEEAAARAALEAEYDRLEQAHVGDDDLPEEVDRRLAELEAGLAAFVNGGGIVGQWCGEISGHAMREGWGGRERSAPSWRRSERAAATARELKQAQDGRLLGAAGSSCAGATTASRPAPVALFCSTPAALRRPADCLRR